MSKDKTEPSNTAAAPSHAKRDLLLAAVALVAFVGLSFGLLTLLSPRAVKTPDPLDEATLPKGERPITLTLLHTNDTWGYLTGCG
jgi:hypothetical protein